MSVAVTADWYSQNIYLILGMLFIFGALASTYAGKTRSRFSGWVYRAEEPGAFWWTVVIYYVAGVLFVVRFWLN
jgi:hypothetical protein